MFVTFFFFSFIFYFLIHCLASLWVNFSSVVVSEIYNRNPDHIIYRLATELNKPIYIYIYMYISKPWARLGNILPRSKCPETHRGMNTSSFHGIPSNSNHVAYTSSLISISSLDTLRDILLTRSKCSKLQRAIILSTFYIITSKSNKVIYTSSSISI